MVRKHDFLLCCLAFFIGARDIIGGLNSSVFVFLTIQLIIPIFILLRDVVNRSLRQKDICLLLFVSLFYLITIPFNENAAKYFLPLFFAGYAFRNTDYKRVGLIFFVTQLVVIAFRFYLIRKGMIEENDIMLDYKTDSLEVGHDLGYGNANAAGMVFFFFFMSLHIILFEKNKWLTFLLILGGSIVAYNYTGSRTAFLVTLFLLFTYLIPQRILGRLMRNKLLLYCVPILLLTPVLFSSFLLNNYANIDDLLSGRIMYINVLMNMFTDPLTYVTGVRLEDIPIDNALCYMLINYGIMSLVLFFSRYVYIVQKKDLMPLLYLVILTIMIISGLGEASWAAFGRMGSSFFWILLYNNTFQNRKVQPELSIR